MCEREWERERVCVCTRVREVKDRLRVLDAGIEKKHKVK